MKIICVVLALFLLAGCGGNTIAPETTVMPDRVLCHVDENDDGLCDICREFMLVRFDIFAVNDLHGKLADTEYQPGVDELTTYLKKEQKSGNTILLSTGDMWQGTSESNMTGGLMMTEWMNRLGFAAMTLGGHEFDWGEDGIRQNAEVAEFPFLGINVYSRQTDSRVDYCQSSLVVDMAGVQIGIIGAIGNCYGSIASQHKQNVYFKTGAELTALVKAESEKLRSQGVDFIVYAIHDGTDKTTGDTDAQRVGNWDLADYYDATLSDDYVDIVFEADTHYWYLLQDQKGIYHLQGGGNNKGISHAAVLINQANGNASVIAAELVPSGQYAHLDDDPVVAELMEKYAQQIAPATRILGVNGQYRSNYAVCQLVASLYCQKGVEKWGQNYDIVLGGGYISCRSPGYLSEGEVSYSQLQSLLPFDNQITLCSIRGIDLLAKFLETDNQAYHIQTTPYGESIRQSIDPNGVYYVVTDSYSADYTYNNMTVIDTYDGNIFARDLLAEYIAGGGMA